MNAADYLWFQGCGLSYSYCLTLVEGLDQATALQRIETDLIGPAAGLPALRDLAGRNSFWDGRNGNRHFIGAAEVDGWTLLLEDNGFLGVTEAVIAPLSAGTQVVSHQRNVDAHDRFRWMVDADLRLAFAPLFPAWRSGSDPDGLVDVMQRVGFDLRDDEDRDYELHTEAAFALAEHLTGVRLTAELLESADYLCGLAPLKR